MLNEPHDMDEVPNPGSDEAGILGCICPVIDNHYGKGVPMGGKREFWITGGCILHDNESNQPSE